MNQVTTSDKTQRGTVVSVSLFQQSNLLSESMTPRWLTVCDVPAGVAKRYHFGRFCQLAIQCLSAGFEDQAASWMWLNCAQNDYGFAPVAGTLSIDRRNGVVGIEYVDARDVADMLKNDQGGGI